MKTVRFERSSRHVSRVSVIVLSAFIGIAWAAETDYQTVPIVMGARSVLHRAFMVSDNYSIGETVTNDGYINGYTLRTDYGTFEVHSTSLLKDRIRELRALERMEEVEQSATFKDSLKRGATAPLRTAKSVIKAPISTTQNVVTGVGKWIGEIGSSVTSDNPNQGNLISTTLGYEVAKRQIAYEFGVDPYTSFEPVQTVLARIARASVAGGLTPSIAFAAVGGVGAQVLVNTKRAEGMRQIVRDKTPVELTKHNRKLLTAMGIAAVTIDVFLENYIYTPAEQTLLVDALIRFDPGHSGQPMGRDIFLAQATTVEAEWLARLMRLTAQAYAAFVEAAGPAEIVLLGDRLWLKTQDRALVGIFAIDYLAHTAEISSNIKFHTQNAAALTGVDRHEFWITGTMHPDTKRLLIANGWEVNTRLEF